MSEIINQNIRKHCWTDRFSLNFFHQTNAQMRVILSIEFLKIKNKNLKKTLARFICQNLFIYLFLYPFQYSFIIYIYLY